MKKLEKNDELKCTKCRAWCKSTEIDIGGLKARGWRCTKCGYELIHPKDVEKAYYFIKARQYEEVKISRRGNSYMMTIPKAIAKALEIAKIGTAKVFLTDANTITVKI